MAKIKKYNKKYYNNITKENLVNDLSPSYPYGGKFLKVGGAELILAKTERRDKYGNPVYIGTLFKRDGLFKRNVTHASHICIKKF